MPAFGPFSSSSETRVDTRNTAFNTGFSEIGGPATSLNLDLGGRVSVGRGGTLAPSFQVTDHGAVAAAHEISSGVAASAFNFAERSAAESAGAVLDLGRAAFDFADASGARERDSLGDAFGFGREAFSFSERASGRQSDFARDLFGDSLAAVTGVVREGQMQLGNTVSNLNAIARQQSTSTDERVQSIARVAIYVAAGVAAILALAFFTRGAS